MTQAAPAAKGDAPQSSHLPRSTRPAGAALAALAFGALGVVYGDIGTSPLYALKECFRVPHGVAPTHENVLGVLSLVFWALNLVVSFKYIGLVMKADNRGEGGILALVALVRQHSRSASRRTLLILGLFGSALLYGDGVITPAISVLGAVEGIAAATPAFAHFIQPLAIVILLSLFLIQRRGTERVGQLFGPIMLVWFGVIAVLGIRAIVQYPAVLEAVNPIHAVRFFGAGGARGLLILGSVVLVVTGGEALYADMGHFGRRPIRLAWFTVALPALLMNYFGQGALLLLDPTAVANPFYSLVPDWFLYPMVVIATLAACVASQALISGSFSLTRQAIQLGYCPRMTIRHTSHHEAGQIYVPEVNFALMVACLWLVVTFKNSDNLAGAYGIAVTGTMTITSLLFYRVMRDLWHWPRWKAAGVGFVFLSLDIPFLLGNLPKIPAGGWFPLVAGAVVYTLMATWKQGRAALGSALREGSLPLDLFLADLERRGPIRVSGAGIFMTSDPAGVPPVLLHHLKHNKTLPETVILLSVQTLEIPQVPASERVQLSELGQRFYLVRVDCGFMETPDIPGVVRGLADRGLVLKPMDTTYYLGRETLLPTGPSKMARWRKRLFIVMSRNAQTATQFFGLPPNRVIELGAQIQL